MSQDVLSPRQLAEEARAHLARPQEWISRVRLRAEGRWYERILMADTYDVRLIRPVDCTFRGISSCGVRTVRRVLTEDERAKLRQELIEGRRDLPRPGAVIGGGVSSLLYIVVDGAGGQVDPVSRYLRDRMLGDVSPLTCRSYAHDLLRWFRLWLQEAAWDQATEAEAAVLVGWLRTAGNPQRLRRRAGSPRPAR